MSSTERAPEPTMEEILASIRRIISDDEASTAPQRATSAEYAEQVRADDTEDGAADTQMIDDIARVLSGSTPTASNDDDIEDILDLTEPGDPALGDVMMADEPVTVLEEVVLETEIYAEAPPKLDFAAAFPARPEIQEMPEPSPTVEVTTDTFEEASASYEEPPQLYEEAPAPVAEMPASEPVMAAEPAPSLEDPTSALERAIAALKAGDLAAFAREAQSDYAAPEPTYATPEPADEAPAAEPESPSFDIEPTLVAMEEDMTVTPEPEPELSVPSWAAERSSWSQASEPSDPEPELEPEFEVRAGVGTVALAQRGSVLARSGARERVRAQPDAGRQWRLRP